MIRHKQHQRLIAEINITPFTDVILVLLIIFMITTPLIYQSSIKVTLPTASTKDTKQENKSFNITINREGMVYLDKNLVTHEELKEKIKSLHSKNQNMSVVLFSDQLVRYKEVVSVMDLLSELGIHNLSLATKVDR